MTLDEGGATRTVAGSGMAALLPYPRKKSADEPIFSSLRLTRRIARPGQSKSDACNHHAGRYSRQTLLFHGGDQDIQVRRYRSPVQAPARCPIRKYRAPALRKLKQLDLARRIEDLRAPPANRLELLKGDRAGQWSVRVNDQFRICFRWTGADAEDVEIVAYH